VHFNPYGGRAAELAVALVNAAAVDTAAVLAEYGAYGSDLTERQAAELRDWARRLSAVFEDAPLPHRVDLVNALLADSASRPYVSCHDGRAPHLHYADEQAGTVARVKAFTAAGLAVALCEDPGRLGRCERPGCAVVFVDTSRNGRRRFCSTRCANRWHVAGHRRRAAGDRPSGVRGAGPPRPPRST